MPLFLDEFLEHAKVLLNRIKVSQASIVGGTLILPLRLDTSVRSFLNSAKTRCLLRLQILAPGIYYSDVVVRQ